MDFNSLLKSRRQTFLFSNKAPEKEKIDSILDAMHNYTPSKQNRIRYDITVFKNDDQEKKLEIYKAGRSEKIEVSSNARYNPQLLAPWLIFFNKRSDVTNYSGYDDKQKAPSNIELGMDIGLASSYIILKAIDLGLSYGYCACTPYSDEYIKPIIKYTGDRKSFGRLIICLGYPLDEKDIKYSDKGIPQYYCPIYKRWELIPAQTFKPEKDEYIRYI